MSLFFLVAGATQLGILAWAVASALRERRAYAALIEASAEPEAAKAALERLPFASRPIARELVEAVSLKSTLDEALSRALVRSVSEPFAPSLPVTLLLHSALILLALLPGVLALLEASGGVMELWAATREMARPAVYLSARSALDPTFAALPGAFGESAALATGLAALWAVSWWLMRPSAREARFVRTLLEVAIRVRPGIAAPASARLAETVAPSRSLERPVMAGVAWAVAIAAGWLALGSAADVRGARGAATTFAVWPATQRPIEVGPEVRLPTAAAGRPLDSRERPTLSISAEQVSLQLMPLAQLANGRLPSDWTQRMVTLDKTLAGFPRPLELSFLVDREVEMDVVVRVMEMLRALHGARRFDLIVVRDVPGAAAGGKARQAVLPVELAPAEIPPALVLTVGERELSLEPVGKALSFATPGWREQLQQIVRTRPPLFQQPSDAPVQIRAHRGARYQRFIEVLAAADGACADQADCGLPGLGLRLVLQP